MSNYKKQREIVSNLKKQRWIVGHLENALDYMRDDTPSEHTMALIKELLAITRNNVQASEAMLDD